MNQITINGKETNTEDDFHDYLISLPFFPGFYGQNLDALWDILTGMIDGPIKITWNDYSLSRQKLGQRAEDILELFKEAEELDYTEIELIVNE